MKIRQFFKTISLYSFLFILLFTFTSAKPKKPRPLPLTSVHVVDRNGFAETISNKDRLKQFQNVDFLKPQTYQKVLRIYGRDSKGNVRSVVTSYYPNGNPKQFLEILNGRASGIYREWHSNGSLSLATRVIGGTPDLTSAAEKTWLFDGISYVWDEENHVIAEIPYSQGVLEGISSYYHPCGQIWKKIPYSRNLVEGVVEIYKDTGELLQQISYIQGIKQGTTNRFWDQNHLASQEEYNEGKLENGQYFDKKGNLIAEVTQGIGHRAIFGKDTISELQEYQMGILEGEVKVFNSQGRLKRVYHVKDRIKHGEEIEYYDTPILADSSSSSVLQSKLSFYWYEGKIQGHVKTWYPNGNLESQREMSNNAKNGVATAWYQDGNLMLIEEYEQDKLVRGDYFKKGEKLPVSQVIQGKGLTTLFDADGHFIQKISYVNGKPDE
jgi:antitoxin component YwqK of YwqJK toxin-antitoxin module